MLFERHIEPKQAMQTGLYIYDRGFGPVQYVCTTCGGTNLEQKHKGGFQPPYYICHDCGETVYAPSWINLFLIGEHNE